MKHSYKVLPAFFGMTDFAPLLYHIILSIRFETKFHREREITIFKRNNRFGYIIAQFILLHTLEIEFGRSISVTMHCT